MQLREKIFSCQMKHLWILVLFWFSDSVDGTKTRSVQEVLVSVEEKLRGLENLGHTMRFSGLHYGMDQMSRRMDAIEARLSQMETKLNFRLDKMNEVATARDRVKVEHIVRNIEAASERTAATLKAQSRVRSSTEECRLFDRMEQMMRDAASKVTQPQNQEGNWETAETKSISRDKTVRYVPEKMKRSQYPRTIDLPTGNTEFANANVTRVTNVKHSDEEVEKHEKDLFGVGEVETFTRKVMNTYKELLKESKAIDASLKDVVEQSNRTRIALADGFRKLHNQQTKAATVTEELLVTIVKKVLEMSATVDSSFASLLVAQNTFITSCHWVQQQQQSIPIEFQIRNIFEEIVDDFRNRTISTLSSSSCDEEGIAQLKKAFENHETDVGRALHDLVWTVIEVGNQTVQDVTRFTCSNNEVTITNDETTTMIERTNNTTESGDDDF